MSITLGPVLHPAHCISELKTRKRDSVLHEVARHVQGTGAARGAEVLHSAFLLRERLGPTALGRGIAFPNARSLCVIEQRVFLARSRRGIDWSAPDGELVHLVMAVVSPPEVSVASHQELLARVVAATRPARLRQKLLEAPGVAELAGLLREALG